MYAYTIMYITTCLICSQLKMSLCSLHASRALVTVTSNSLMPSATVSKTDVKCNYPAKHISLEIGKKSTLDHPFHISHQIAFVIFSSSYAHISHSSPSSSSSCSTDVHKISWLKIFCVCAFTLTLWQSIYFIITTGLSTQIC